MSPKEKRRGKELVKKLSELRQRGYNPDDPVVVSIVTGGRDIWMEYNYNRFGSKTIAVIPDYEKLERESSEKLFHTALSIGKFAQNLESAENSYGVSGSLVVSRGIKEALAINSLYLQSGMILRYLFDTGRVNIDTSMAELLGAAKYAERGSTQRAADNWAELAIRRATQILDEDERIIQKADRRK